MCTTNIFQGLTSAGCFSGKQNFPNNTKATGVACGAAGVNTSSELGSLTCNDASPPGGQACLY